MMNSSASNRGQKTLDASRSIVRRLVCGAGLVLCASWAAAQDRAPALSLENWDKSKFDSNSATINNPWLPMKPGTKYVYVGTTVESDGKVVPHRLELNITDLVKVIDGVTSLVSYDLDFSDGELEEAELAFFAQDKDGNVWHLGQYPEEYDNGKFSKAPAWIHGIVGAHAGIMMKAEPKLGTPSYSQGYGPAVDWTDRGQTHEMGKTTKTRAGTFKNVLVIKETATSEIDAQQFKWYAKGTGNVRVTWGGKDQTKETLELLRVEKMTPKQLAAVREKALRLEKSAYVRSKDVYALTSPSKVPKP